ncbi:zinc finger protein 518B [Rhineura floridana]|uniref:zinc finger protein 518B n=1 Tax=Rhineura floridana TaxID=261503 RepID=UPI002AC7FC81|nr:zinc finger protein 518B [Rhineura floridana]XP_061440469.1 zinc finger protein 518B [Rhineura floridana]
MQLKKMRGMLPMLNASEVNKGHILLMSAKKTSVDKANSIKANDENCNFVHQKTEETELYQINCIKCRCVEETLALELQKQKFQKGEVDQFVCSKCTLSAPSVLNFGIYPAVACDTENKEKMSLSKTLRTFKVKNLQPDKYYCDKCRFCTKDFLQYKKHVAHHEKIKFICSQCNWVSYTKGEFQRHRVKHTGRFPYQCKYCKYGAVRHDYIVKHTKRLHASDSGKQVMLSIAKVERKNCSPKQHWEWREHAKEEPLQNKSSSLSLSMIYGIKDEIPEIDSTSDDAECSQSTACIQDEYVYKLSDVTFHKNENTVIEVEVCSPEKGRIMPGMPLTVVAPAKFCVPSNCLAEIVEIKKVSGTQQLILKFIPLEETTPELMKCKDIESGNQCAEQEEKTINGCMPLTLESCALENENNKKTESPGSSSSATLNCNLINTQEKSGICKENTHKEYDHIKPLAEISFDQTNCPEPFQKGECSQNKYTNYDLDPSISLTSTPSVDRNPSQNCLLDAVQENNNFSPSSVFDKMCFTLSNGKREHWDEFTVAAKTHIFDSDLFYPFKSIEESQHNKLVTLEDSKNVLSVINGINVKKKKDNIRIESSEAQNMKDEGDSFDGPVISSVFSLSSGAVNIPEGIKWDDTLHKKRTTSMLCRKIAQLMSAVESNMKSQLTASLRHDNSQASKKMLSPENESEKNGLTTVLEQELVPCPWGSNDTTFSNKQEQPLQTLKKTKTRITDKTNIASPSFIPQGTVLRVLNCTSFEGPNEKQNGSEMLAPPSQYYNKTFIPRPVPCYASAKPDKDPSLPTENEINEVSQNQCMSHGHKTKRLPSAKSNCQENGMLLCQKGSDPNMVNKRAMEGEEPQSKCKRAHAEKNLPKEKTRTQEGCFLKVVPTLMRCLRLVPFKSDQLIKCPHRNQPVVVLNHPDIDSPEVINIMKVINKYKGNVLKAVLSERTSSCLSVKRHPKRLTFQNFDRPDQMKKQNLLRMKLKKTHKDNYKVVNSSVAEASKQMFKCWFCGRIYVHQEEWLSHGQKHLMEATRGWDILSFSLESKK